MEVQKTNSRLRLIARTLIEWQTPATSPDYQEVLTEVMTEHVGAKLYDLLNRKDIISLDHEGCLLLFLTETLEDRDVDDWIISEWTLAKEVEFFEVFLSPTFRLCGRLFQIFHLR